MALPSAALLPVLCAWTGVPYADLGRSTAALLRVVLPMELLSLLWLALATAWAGWWPSGWQASPGPRWPRWAWALPLLWLLACGLRWGTVDWARLPGADLGWLLLATALVGVHEELLFRGVVVWAARGGRPLRAGNDWRACWVSSLAFGAFHLPNALAGEALGVALFQVGLAVVMGGALYAALRLSGRLILPMGLHLLWDFSTFAVQRGGGAAEAGPGLTLAGLAVTVLLGLAVLARALGLWRQARAGLGSGA